LSAFRRKSDRLWRGIRPLFRISFCVFTLHSSLLSRLAAARSHRDKGSTHCGKPADVHGIEVRWAILDHDPAGIEEFVNSAFDTASPLYLEFGEEYRGKRVYMTGRWEIEWEGEAIVP
jgi:hypothetical protein